MAAVLHKTADPVDYRPLANTPDFPAGTWFINPDVSAVVGVDQKYWSRPLADPVTEMSQGEKDAVDAAELAAQIATAQAGAIEPIAEDNDPIAMRMRAYIELANKRDNFLTNRVIELQNRVQAMLDSSGNVANMKTAGLAVAISATATRTRADAITDYRAIVNNGDVNVGE